MKHLSTREILELASEVLKSKHFKTKGHVPAKCDHCLAFDLITEWRKAYTK